MIKQSLLANAKSGFLELFNSRRQRICFDPPIVSLTFDDVPISAYENGRKILEDAEVRGTFYVSLGIKGASNDYIREDETRLLYSRGHTIGCHTSSHYSLKAGSAAGMMIDSKKNRTELESILGCKIDHFSYPFGEVSLGAKRVLSPSYMTLRGIRRGINWGTVDLNLLRAIPIYAETFSEKSLRDILKAAVKLKGWIVFYTHGVTDAPERFDATPYQLRSVLEIAQQEGFRIQTMDEVAALLHKKSEQ